MRKSQQYIYNYYYEFYSMFLLQCFSMACSLLFFTATGMDRNKNLYSGVILQTFDPAKNRNEQWYITEGTANKFAKLQNIQRVPDQIPEYKIDMSCTRKTIKSLCKWANSTTEAKDTASDELWSLAGKLGAYSYLIHPESEVPVRFPDTVARSYQKNFKKRLLTESDTDKYPLRHYQALFAKYDNSVNENKTLIAQPFFSYDDFDQILNLHEMIIQDGASSAQFSSSLRHDFVHPLVATITDKEMDIESKKIAVQQYTYLFEQSPASVQKELAAIADADSPEITLSDALYELMYNRTTSPTWNALMTESSYYYYYDNQNYDNQNTGGGEPLDLKRGPRILNSIKRGLNRWQTEDIFAKLFWTVEKKNNEINLTKKIMWWVHGDNYGTDILQLFAKNLTFFPLDEDTKQSNKNFENYLSGVLCKEGKLKNNNFKNENAHRTHLPFIAVLFGPFYAQGSRPDYYWMNAADSVPLRQITKEDCLALNTLQINSNIAFSIDTATKIAPLTTCKRPLDIVFRCSDLPQSLQRELYNNPNGNDNAYCILPPWWRLHTILEVGAIAGFATLVFKYFNAKAQATLADATIQTNAQVHANIVDQVLTKIPEIDRNSAQFYFQRAHAKTSFGKPTASLLGDILDKPVDTSGSCPLNKIDTLKNLVQTTRTIEKKFLHQEKVNLNDSQIPVSYSITSTLIAVIGSLICDLYRKTPPLPQRLIGLVLSPFMNPARFVEPLHKIRIIKPE
jgi:hypothetical protein